MIELSISVSESWISITFAELCSSIKDPLTDSIMELHNSNFGNQYFYTKLCNSITEVP